jgi:SAM-dependent methyltransferase
MNLLDKEREKYRRMWREVPGYRSNSPGERLVPEFLRRSGWQGGDTLIDLGCGPGRAGAKLRDAGLSVTFLDITVAAPDPTSIAKPFIEACLWELPPMPVYDWAYCCDVLEHIPPSKVDKVLDNIRVITGKGAFLQIALWPESWGNEIHETLHLTVKPSQWWKPKISKRWKNVEFSDSGDGRLIALTGKPSD